MARSNDPRARLFRMEEARRQTQRQLDMIDRQIMRRMTALIPAIGRKHSGYRRGRHRNRLPSWSGIGHIWPP